MKSMSFVAATLLSVSFAACSSSSPTAPSSLSSSSGASIDQTAAKGGRAALPTIVGIASSNSDFSTLVAAVVRAEFVDLLNGNRHYTVFAPTNAAFDALAPALGFTTGLELVQGLDLDTLKAVLSYHVTRGDRNATSVVSAASLRMLSGKTASVTVNNGNAFINNAKIVATDIWASNGIVHVIDAVLVPPAN